MVDHFLLYLNSLVSISVVRLPILVSHYLFLKFKQCLFYSHADTDGECYNFTFAYG